MLAITTGYQGVGKSTVARQIQEVTGGILRRTDKIRKKYFPNCTFCDEDMQRVYDKMFEIALEDVVNGPVVLDATFLKHINREQAKRIAEEAGLEFRLVHVVLPDESIIKYRMEVRKKKDSTAAGFDVYLRFKPLFEPVVGERITIDNSGTEAETLAQVQRYFNNCLSI